MNITADVIIVGAGAAGLMCAIEAAKRGRKTIVLDHANKAGKKILMSGGGRCNFTNYNINPTRYISQNPHFCKSALSRYTQFDFIELVKKYKIPFHEKTEGQLFCDNKSSDILNMLLTECKKYNAEIYLNTTVADVVKENNNHFKIKSNNNIFNCESLVIASGGLSIPTMGASAFGYKLAEKFGLTVLPTRAGLVPLTLHTADKERFSELSGVSAASIVSNNKQKFRENILFTHRGLSGPAILQISSYWHAGETININLLPDLNVLSHLTLEKKLKSSTQSPKQLKSIINNYLPKRVVTALINNTLLQKTLPEMSAQEIEQVANNLNCWQLAPNGTEGYRTAEVTLGGIDCKQISSKTMEVNNIAGLYFIGEVLDVSGWLGGYNFQWAWSSGWAAGQVV